jgi:uncharacterized membrane protein YsdA (DUF1294 family)
VLAESAIIRIATEVATVIICLLSVISLAQFGIDKHRARLKQSRIPESHLLLVAFLGGWPGSLLGMMAFRHKTIKRSFQIKFAMSVIVSLAAYLGVFAFLFQARP